MLAARLCIVGVDLVEHVLEARGGEDDHIALRGKGRRWRHSDRGENKP